MINKEISKIFFEMADYLKMKEETFRSVAYNKVALSLESMEQDVEDIYNKGGLKALEDLPGVGKNIAQKIEEYIKTGKIKAYLNLKKQTPIKLDEISRIEGMGPKKAKVLFEKLGIKNIKDLEKAAKSHKIAPLFGFGEKTEKNILEGIEFLKKDKGRFLLGSIMPSVEEILEKLSSLKEIKQISIAGSTRRMKETVGDVDILVAVKPAFAEASAGKIMNFFVSLPGIVKVWGKGKTKSSVRMKHGFDVDLRIVKPESFGSALQYFTGSKEHNIATRKIAISKGLKLNEYGVFKGQKMIAGRTEQDVYKAIGLSYIAPEMREDTGEVELAQKAKLPNIIGYDDIKGDLHCHSNWDGGEHSIKEMIASAQKMGYEYIGISDHTKFLKIEKGLNEKQLLDQRKEIEKLNNDFRVLQGCEANIMPDGSLDIKDSVLAKLDFVIAGVHSAMKMPRDKMTQRIINAMKNPNVDIISHPTGRLLLKRDEYQIDFDKILRAAKEYNVVLEINSSPERLDLKDTNIKKAKEAGVKMVINTDAHHKNQLELIKFGIAQARRGWAEKKDILNTDSADKLLSYFKNAS
ncbi:DNA polymerase III [Parcubacteria bacterium DG_72]|nr:MAG: DNA polymerase III [Parcubacteria bacterium DG_72]